MLSALMALIGAALTVAACYAAGLLLAERLGAPLRQSEKFPLAFVLGAACLHLAIFAVLAVKIAYKPVLITLVAGVLALAIRTGAWGKRGVPMKPLERRLKIGFGVIFGAFTFLYFVNALAPESSPDGSGYHLGFVARYLRAHGFERITTNIYASLSAGVEMLFVPAFAIGRHSAAALVHFAFAIALALAVFAYGRRIGRPWAGAAGALLVYASPVAGIDGTSAYNDVALAAIVFSVFYWLEIWDETRDARLLIPIGLLAGYAYATKYTAFVIVPYALGFIAWRTRRLRPLLVPAACAVVMIAPWMIKNWINVQNPIAPFGNRIFRNPYVHVLFEQEYGEYLRRYEVSNKWTLPLEVTLYGQKTTGVIGMVFLAAPLSLLSLRYRAGRRLLVPGFLMLAVYLANVGTRFLIPCLPFFSLTMALALENAKPLLAAMVVFHAMMSSPWVMKHTPSRYAWRLDRIPYKEALRRIPQDRYLRENDPAYGLARMIESNVPKGERVMATDGVAQAYTSREILVGFQGAFNSVLEDTLTIGWSEDHRPRRMRVFRFPARTSRRIRVMQTAMVEGKEQWSVHELRFLRNGVELPRRPEWRLRAWPNPWEVQLAFDNSQATRWRSWEVAGPGMYIDVDFGYPEALDEVRIETSWDYRQIRLQVEAMDEHGRWLKIADKPEDRENPIRGSIRRAATYELHERGVNYLLISDTGYGADDFRDDPEAWGLTLVANGYGARLYKVTP